MNRNTKRTPPPRSKHGQAIRAYRYGLTTREIAKAFRVSHTTVATWLAKWNVPRRPPVDRLAGNQPTRRRWRDLTGRRIGRLTILERIKGTYPIHWLCQCDCGTVRAYSINRLARIRSCGCAPKGRRRSS